MRNIVRPTFKGNYAFPYEQPSLSANRLANSGLLNNEQLDILDVREGWYKVKVRTNSDPAVVGQEFWVLRWIVDNVDVPPQPTLTPTSMPTPTSVPTNTPIPKAVPTATQTPSAPSYEGSIARHFPNTANSGDNRSCINGNVKRRNGARVSGATIKILLNGSVKQIQYTNGSGDYSACGLGYSQWSVVLDSIPANAGGLASSVTVLGVWLNGSPQQLAGVNFRER